MRIVGGDMRGRTLEAPRGRGTRPTADRVRESLMSSIYSARVSFSDAVVLDAFAGSGALGLEAISRGAAFAAFCENDAGAVAVIRRNLAQAPAGSALLQRLDIFRQLPRTPPSPFDLVFFDPPYATPPADLAHLTKRLDAAGLLAQECLVSYEHAKSDDSAVRQAFAALPWSCATIDLLRKDSL